METGFSGQQIWRQEVCFYGSKFYRLVYKTKYHIMKKLILLELAFIFLATTFSSSPPPGWYQQTLPVSDQINDIFFLDSLNGWVVTPSGYILSTQNGGDNWSVQKNSAGNLYSIQFIDSQTGYVLGNGNHGIIYKTTNGGTNWNLIHDFNPAGTFRDMSFVNKDIGWVCSDDPFDGGVFKTTNGGLIWEQQLNYGLDNPYSIFFVNKDIGWIGTGDGHIYKSINGGANWNLQASFNAIKDILFVNHYTGWVTDGGGSNVKYTSNGGENWIYQHVPPEGGLILFSRPSRISSINGINVWGVGGTVFFGMGRVRGIIYKSTNGGNNWYYQLPDTSINIGNYTSIQFINDSAGWASSIGLIHTSDGGGSLVKVTNINSEVSKNYKLYQNYPNPFNPKTIICYELRVKSYVILKVYNIQGIEMKTLVNQIQNSGEYKYELEGINLNSGVYFYRFEVIDEMTKEVFSETKKILLVK